MSKLLLAGSFFLLIVLGCQESAETESLNVKNKIVVPAGLLDSLSFEIVHPVVRHADSLLRIGTYDEAYYLFDSLEKINFDDPYLEFYIKTQSARNGLSKLSPGVADSLVRSRVSALESLERKPFCLQLQVAFIGTELDYRVDGFEYTYPNNNFLLNNLNVGSLNKINQEAVYDVLKVNAAKALYSKYDPYRAKDYYGKLESMIQKGLYKSPKMIGQLHYYLAEVYRQLYNYEIAVDYAEQSIQALRETKEYNFLAFAMSQKLNNYGKLGNVIEGNKLLNELQNFVEIHDIKQSNRFLFLRNYSGTLNGSESLEQNEKLILLLEKEMNIQDTLQIAELLEQKSWIASDKEDYRKAIEYYKEAIRICQEYSNTDETRVGKYYTNIGIDYSSLGMMDSAIINYYQGIKTKTNTSFDIQKFPNKKILDEIDEVSFSVEKLALALQKSDFPTGSKAKNLELAAKYYDYLIALFDANTKGKEDQALLRDLSEFHDVFGGAIRCKIFSEGGFVKNKKEIFSLMEKSKALLLQNSIYARALADQLGIPDELFEQLMNLEEEIANIQTNTSEGEEVDSLQLSYLNLVKEKKQLLEEINNSFPEFLKRIQGAKGIALEAVQNKLNRNESLIQFHWTDEGLYAVSISKDNVLYKNIEAVEELDQRLVKFINQISISPGANIQELSKTFIKDATWLDSVLLSGLFDKEHTKSLIIIPDGPLGKLPFELLTSTIPKDDFTFYDIDYLIKTVAVNYGFSSSLFFQQKELNRRMRNPKINLFAYSDQAEISTLTISEDWDELPSSGREVDEVASVLSSYSVKKWKGKNCTKNNFSSAAKYADVLHLALHGQSDPINRWGNKIKFKGEEFNTEKNNVIYGYELRGMKMNTSFVFLSACESGRGKIESGEGVYSLGRNFAGAGVPSIVMGLWNLNDEISKNIVVDFYSALKDGVMPSKALQFAKKNHLKNADDRLSHPYYWAPTIAIGGGPSPFK